MNDLKNKFVNVVVAVDEGRGFDMVKNRLFIMAKLSGRIMESDMIPAVPSPMFNTELVWETEKKDLRKARGDYGSIRVDCFTIDEDNKRDSVGYLMLLLRSAHIIPTKGSVEAPFSWEKLRGVPDDYKKYTPTLRISFALKDTFTSIAVQTVPLALSLTPSLDIMANQKEIIPVKFTENGFIMIGESDEYTMALELKITVQIASNLDLLLPKDLVFSAIPKKYYFAFTVFGMTVQTRSFYRALHECITLNETVVISLQSSIEMLKTFFTQYSCIEMMFFNDTQQLGWTEINIATIINQIEKTNFAEVVGARIEIDEECIIRTKDGGIIPLAKDGIGKPTVDVHSVLEKVVRDKEKGQGEHCVGKSNRVVRIANNSLLLDSLTEEVDEDQISNMSDDTMLTEKVEVCTKVEKKASASLIEILPKIEEVNEHYDYESKIKPELIMPKTSSMKTPKCDFKKYCLAVILDSIVWIKAPKNTTHHFHFVNQRAGSKLTFKTNIDNKIGCRYLLDGIHCHILYITALDRLKQTLHDWGPQILILDSTGTTVISSIKVATDTIAKEETRHHTYSVKVKNKARKEVFAEVTLILSLEEVDLKTQVQSTNELHPVILDDFIVLKQLEELELWKLEQQQKHEGEMAMKIQEELTELRKSWSERKTKLEDELKKNIARCKKISKELKKSANTLEIDKVLQKNQNKTMINLNEDIQRNYIKYSICENYELIETITIQERDLILLKEMLNEAQLRVQELEKTALTGEQTKNLLQELRALEEKYETAQKAKDYFKEQWKKSAIEVHQLKIADNVNIKKSIQESIDELNLMTMKTYVYDTRNDKNIEWKKTLLKSSLLDEKVNLIEKHNFATRNNDN